MAACAHVWHYKCISRLLHSPDYPMFQCPNCRAFTDLSAEVDDSNDNEAVKERVEAPETLPASVTEQNRSATRLPTNAELANADDDTHHHLEPHREEHDLVTDVENLHIQDDQAPEADTEDTRSSASPAPNASNDDLARSATVNIPGWQPTQPLNVPPGRQAHLRADTPVRSETSDENPLTPRNDSGPLAFDGRAGMP